MTNEALIERPAASIREQFRGARLVMSFLLALGVIYTLYFAQELVLPIFVAAMLALILSPVVEALRRIAMPEALGAAIVVALLVALCGIVVYVVIDPVERWVADWPNLAQRLRDELRSLTAAVKAVEAVSGEVSEIAAGGQGAAQEVVVQEKSPQSLVAGWLQTTGFTILSTLVLLYFLLARGRRTVLRILGAISDRRRRRKYQIVIERIRRQTATYLGTVTAINIVLGALTGAILYGVGLPNPVFWGVVAGLLNFVPYLGPAVTTALLVIASILAFDSLGEIVLVPMSYLILSALEGGFIMPSLVGRRLTVNPILVFLSIIICGWAWGVVGAVLAVPILAVIRSIVIQADVSPALRAAME